MKVAWLISLVFYILLTIAGCNATTPPSSVRPRFANGIVTLQDAEKKGFMSGLASTMRASSTSLGTETPLSWFGVMLRFAASVQAPIR